jgi:nucleoside-diphosphate-sugar epimerase
MTDSKELLCNSKYLISLETILSDNLPWKELQDKSFVIAGSSGLIGSCLIDSLMFLQKQTGISFKIFALGRNLSKLQKRFSAYKDNKNLKLIEQDVLNTIVIDSECKNVDYIIHLASNTHPVDYATKPVDTILANIEGTKNLLDFARSHNNKRFIYASSVEIYGENRGDVGAFKEDYCGYINCNTLRAGYPEGKRAGEALCQAYIKEHNIDIVIPRFCRIYGPTMLMSDTKALSQFIKNSLNGEDIVLKSEGKQFFSYLDVYDAVSSIFYCLFYGERGEAYNVSDKASDITLRDLAQLIAKANNTSVVFELPSEIEKTGFSKATKAILDSAKLQKLGWNAKLTIEDGLKETISILKDLNR